MSNKIQRYVQGTFSTRGCNLDCSYCYLKMKRLHNNKPPFPYGIEHIAKAMSTRRWGRCYISLTGDGETLLSEDVVDLAYLLLKEGHYINIINNGTQTHSFKYMSDLFDKECISRSMLTFSLHYIELCKKNLLDQFFTNIRFMRDQGYTIYIHMVLNDDYFQHCDEIKNICLKEVGILPQLGIIRDESDRKKGRIITQHTQAEFYKKADSFQSPYFEMQKRLYEENYSKEYCYAGKLGVLLDFTTGLMRQCVANNDNPVNVFDDISKELSFQEVGFNCRSPWCYCSTLQVLGMIANKDYPSFSMIFEKGNNPYISDAMRRALDVKLADEFIRSKNG